MTISEIRNTLVAVDPSISHYFSMGTGKPYTYWEETQRVPLMGDGGAAEEGWRFTVHRFARQENDSVAAGLLDALENDDRITVDYLVDYERETGYIHHIFDCECF